MPNSEYQPKEIQDLGKKVDRTIIGTGIAMGLSLILTATSFNNNVMADKKVRDYIALTYALSGLQHERQDSLYRTAPIPSARAIQFINDLLTEKQKREATVGEVVRFLDLERQKQEETDHVKKYNRWNNIAGPLMLAEFYVGMLAMYIEGIIGALLVERRRKRLVESFNQ